jgi:Zn ribbon nucleic-acid-binding protein
MKGTATLEKIIGQVHDMSASTYDEVVPVSDIHFHSLDHARVAGQEVIVLPSAQRLVANRLKVPHSYLERCPSALQADNLNTWMEEERKSRETLFCRFDGRKLRAVFTDRYTELNNMEVLARMLECGFTPSTQVQYILDASMMVLNIPDPNRAFWVKPQDKMVPGVSIGNSEVGVLSFSIQCFLLRLVCTNGMVSTTKSSSSFRHVSRKAIENFADILKDVAAQSQAQEGRLRFSVDTHVENPPGTIGTFNRQFQIPQDVGEMVVRSWELEPAYTMFGVVNAYTYTAQHANLTAEQSYKLEKTGGQILSLLRPM